MENRIFSQICLNSILHFGAIISISPSNSEKEDFIHSDGFIIKKINLESSFIYNKDFSGTNFKITPVYKSDTQNIIENFSENMEDLHNSLDNFKLDIVLDDLDSEFKANNQKYTSMNQTPIFYGQPFQFEHLNSKKFLSYKPESTSFENFG